MYLGKNIVIFLVVLFSALISACSSDSSGGNVEKAGNGTISGVALNAADNTPLAGVQIVVQDSSGAEVASTNTNDSGSYAVTLTAGKSYSLLFTLSTHYPETYSNISVLKNENNILAALLQIDTSITGTGTISGKIIDAQTGLNIDGATLNFRVGINIQSGTIAGSTITDTQGNYSIDTLSTGNYTCEIILDNYTTAYATVIVLGGKIRSNQSTSLTRVLQTGEIRIVLGWGAPPTDPNDNTPEDLDAHITGPTSDNSIDRFHIYWRDQGSIDVNPFVTLDRDDIDFIGPETVTIASQFQGTYRYSVHDFINFNLATTPGSTGLANSSAKVTVYQANQTPRVFNVPNNVGVLWTVFELNGSTITPINTMTDTVDDLSIQSISVNNDKLLISNLPQQK